MEKLLSCGQGLQFITIYIPRTLHTSTFFRLEESSSVPNGRILSNGVHVKSNGHLNHVTFIGNGNGRQNSAGAEFIV